MEAKKLIGTLKKTRAAVYVGSKAECADLAQLSFEEAQRQKLSPMLDGRNLLLMESVAGKPATATARIEFIVIPDGVEPVIVELKEGQMALPVPKGVAVLRSGD